MSELTYPVRGEAYTMYTGLQDQTDTRTYKSSPTLAAGDVKVSKDGGAFNNIASLPTSVGKSVIVSLSAAEMTADSVVVLFSDAAGSEWCDSMIALRPAARSFSNGGIGSIAWVYPVVDTDGNPLSNAVCWVTSDIDGTVVVAGDITDAEGNAHFWTDAGTWYVWTSKQGYRFANPDTEIVSA